MKTFANGIATNYRLSGSGSPLVLIHALGLDLRQWRWQLPDLADRHQVLTYDVRGHGQTDKPAGPYSIEMLADDLYGLLVALGIDRADVLGLSLGGMVAQAFALAYPQMVERLVLADTASDYSPDVRRMFEARARLVETQGVEAVIENSIERWFTPSFRQAEVATVDEIRAILRRNDPSAYAAACLAVSRLNLSHRLSEIGCPTLVLVGEEDPGTPVAVAQGLHEAIEGSRLEVIPGASHLSNISHPAEFNALVRDFLG